MSRTHRNLDKGLPLLQNNEHLISTSCSPIIIVWKISKGNRNSPIEILLLLLEFIDFGSLVTFDPSVHSFVTKDPSVRCRILSKSGNAIVTLTFPPIFKNMQFYQKNGTRFPLGDHSESVISQINLNSRFQFVCWTVVMMDWMVRNE